MRLKAEPFFSLSFLEEDEIYGLKRNEKKRER
jgi:hypothetical protein